ncbi:unnamed protein product [Oikopleura dioica]|uniref:Uncharacterized protein n=1 Tax=Oikopleura dioica TaxID=34765 RepID=E4YRJ7_OIKDI|nr:unnamed protein product [Oikopleura dioica]
MKLFGFTLAAVALAQNDTFVPAAAAEAARSFGVELTGSTCFKCEGNSYQECMDQADEREGGPVSCRSDKMCSITERRRGGEIERVEMRCKQNDVCRMEVQHNLRPCPQMTWVTECHQMEKDENGAEVPSVCRKCFGQDKDIEFVKGFVNGVGYADYQGANGLILDHWMSE